MNTLMSILMGCGIGALICTPVLLYLSIDSKIKARRLERYMGCGHVIQSVFLPAPGDEGWQYELKGDAVSLSKVRIVEVGASYTLQIGDTEMSVPYKWDTKLKDDFSTYCSRTHQHHRQLGKERLAQERLKTMSEASEKHVAGLIE